MNNAQCSLGVNDVAELTASCAGIGGHSNFQLWSSTVVVEDIIWFSPDLAVFC
jgi:hypothetical protein